MSSEPKAPEEDYIDEDINDDDPTDPDYWYCSSCGKTTSQNPGGWGCPRCGAIMEGEWF